MKLLRKLYIKTSDLTHGYQGNKSKITSFYRLWAPLYDISIKLDPAYIRNLRKMIESTVALGDYSLDIGCGTGLGTIHAATIAQKVLGLDYSKDMLNKCQKKIKNHKINNIDLREGFFPQALKPEEIFDSIITSFMLAHFNKEQRMQAIKDIFEALKPNGKIGLFSAQGEIASTFQTKKEIEINLSSAGFCNIMIEDVDDIYRISIAEK